MSTFREEHEDPEQRWTEGPSIDGTGEFSFGHQPGGGEPDFEAVIEAMHNDVS